jgi:predicted porin
MKKHLLAAAVATAIAAPAMAQNVQLSGRIDTTVGSAKNASGDSTTRVQSGVMTTPQLVFTSSEDLGGGLKAGFVMATEIASDTAASPSFGDRGAEASISGAFGAVAIGKSGGTMLNSTKASGVTGNIGNLSSLISRPANMVSYTLPAMSGFTVKAIYAAGGETKPKVNGQNEISVAYANGPLAVRAARQKMTNVSVAAVTANATYDIYGNGAAAAAAYNDTSITETGGDVNYTMGSIKLNARMLNRKHSTNPTKDFDSYGVGAAFSLGNGLTAAVDYAASDVNNANKDSNVTSASLVKALSKRTDVYAVVASKDYQNTASETARLFAVGIRHNF